MTSSADGASGPATGRPAARRIGETARVARRPGVLCRRLEGETILLDPENGTYYALNEVGSRVWELAEGRPTVASILERLEAEYAVDRVALESDLDELLAQLAAEELVEISEARSGEPRL